MKLRIIFVVFFSLLLLFLIPFSFGAEGKQGAAISDKGPSVYFPSMKFKFPPVAEGIVVRHNFIVQNKGDKTLHIEKIKTG